MREEQARSVTSTIFDLYRKRGADNYLGEDISQQDHMTQCAMLAEEAGYSNEVILGALFHDIGHLVGLDRKLEEMGKGIGTKRHDVVGAEFLEDLGFPVSLTQLVRHHVNAKRYLVYKHADYHDKLSSASKQTLIQQGGPMKEDEAKEFEKLQNFKAVIDIREWDDLGKIEGKIVQPIEKYVEMCRNYLIQLA
eukprot:gene8223-9103_t